MNRIARITSALIIFVPALFLGCATDHLLRQAIKSNDIAKASQLLGTGRQQDLDQLLYETVYDCCKEGVATSMLSLLIEKGANPNAEIGNTISTPFGGLGSGFPHH